MLIAPVAVNPDVLSGRASAGTAERFDGEDIAFLHALVGSRLDEGDLFVAVDVVAEDIVAGDAADGFDGDSLAVEFDFVALHHFLHYLAHMIHAGVDTSFL